jgi:hypothetical protein
MSFFLYDFNAEFNFDKLLLGKKINFNNNLFRYYLYYLDGIPKELYIKLPSIRIIYSYKNNKYNQIKLPIYPVYDQTSKFIQFIKQLKKKIKDLIIIDKPLSILEKTDKINILKINVPIDFKIKSKEKIIIKDFKLNSELYGILSIPYIWENEKSFGLAICALELNYIQSSNEFDNHFIDNNLDTEIIINKTVKDNNLDTEIIINKPVKDNNPHKIIKNNKFMISPNLLVETMNKLNKINSNGLS